MAPRRRDDLNPNVISNRNRFGAALSVVVIGLAAATPAIAAKVSGRVQFGSAGADAAVVSLVPLAGTVKPVPITRTIRQEGLAFRPPLTVIPVESTIVFENHDQEMHNVHSASPANRFDVGLHMPGAVKQVVFAKPGPVRIVCKIHPEMHATILVVAADRFALSDAAGYFEITNVAPGAYRAVLWHPRLTPEEAAAAARELQVASAGATLEFDLQPSAPSAADLVDVPSRDWAPVLGEIEAALGQAFDRWTHGAATAAQIKVRTTHSRLYHQTGLRESIVQRLGKEHAVRHDQAFDRLGAVVRQGKADAEARAAWRREQQALLKELRASAAALTPVLPGAKP